MAHKRILITGAGGLLGFHAKALLHSVNASLEYAGKSPSYTVLTGSREDFEDGNRLAQLVHECDAVLHLAGINRATPDQVAKGNQAIATKLIAAMRQAGAKPHLVYANSSHIAGDSDYGRGKKAAGELLEAWADEVGSRYSNLVLPHIFGEGSVPFYNTVTATLCHQVAAGETPEIHDGARVELLHAGSAVERMLEVVHSGETGSVRMEGIELEVQELYSRLLAFKRMYDANELPDLKDRFVLNLFNTLRSFLFPAYYPKSLVLNVDARGNLFEAVKGGGGGQTFASWTEPGVVRGNHYHRYKMERFLVLSGKAKICIRRLFDSTVHSFDVSGDKPVAIDMPTLHTHSIINTGDEPLLTLFWAHELFDPEHPDTYAHNVDTQGDP